MMLPSYCSDNPFEAGFLGAPVWRLNDAREATTAIQHDVGLISCRIAEGDDDSQLLKAGFRQVETLVTLRAAIWRVDDAPKNVRRCQIDDADECAAVAKVAFKDDRFHQDPNISNDVADNIKAAWVVNSINGRANAVFCAEINREIIGFNACLLKGDDAVIDLIGVHPQVQGQGVGTSLLDIMALFYRGRASHIKLGTQLSNTGSLEFYDSLGFEEIARAQTWHWTPAKN